MGLTTVQRDCAACDGVDRTRANQRLTFQSHATLLIDRLKYACDVTRDPSSNRQLSVMLIRPQVIRPRPRPRTFSTAQGQGHTATVRDQIKTSDVTYLLHSITVKIMIAIK